MGGAKNDGPAPAVEQLFLYESEQAAAAAIKALDAAARQCGWERRSTGNQVLSAPTPEVGLFQAGQMGNAVFIVRIYRDGFTWVTPTGDAPFVAHELCVKMAICTNGPGPTTTPS